VPSSADLLEVVDAAEVCSAVSDDDNDDVSATPSPNAFATDGSCEVLQVSATLSSGFAVLSDDDYGGVNGSSSGSECVTGSNATVEVVVTVRGTFADYDFNGNYNDDDDDGDGGLKLNLSSVVAAVAVAVVEATVPLAEGFSMSAPIEMLGEPAVGGCASFWSGGRGGASACR
jgi:hypothetical protein